MLNSSAGGQMCTAVARDSPTINAPMAAPSMLPSPPMMTTANDTMITPTLKPGCTEIIGAVDLLKARYKVRAPLFRPPYGEFNDLTVEVVRKLGLQFILWNVVSGDPDPSLSADKMLAHLTASTRGGNLIVFHANGKGVHTREVVDRLTQEFFPKRGLKPVTVTELLACVPQAKP